MSTNIRNYNNYVTRNMTVFSSVEIPHKELEVMRVCGHHNLVTCMGEESRRCLQLTIFDANDNGECTAVDKIQQIHLTNSQAKMLIDDLQEYFDLDD